MLMSDTTFHLDESLKGLAQVNTIRAQIANTEEWNARPEAERKDLQGQLFQAESNAPFHTSMGRSHVKLIRDFTATTKEPFLTGEIVGRLAAVSRRGGAAVDLAHIACPFYRPSTKTWQS